MRPVMLSGPPLADTFRIGRPGGKIIDRPTPPWLVPFDVEVPFNSAGDFFHFFAPPDTGTYPDAILRTNQIPRTRTDAGIYLLSATIEWRLTGTAPYTRRTGVFFSRSNFGQTAFSTTQTAAGYSNYPLTANNCGGGLFYNRNFAPVYLPYALPSGIHQYLYVATFRDENVAGVSYPPCGGAGNPVKLIRLRGYYETADKP